MARLNMTARAATISFVLATAAGGSAVAASFISPSSEPFTTGNRLLGADACVNGGPLAGICTTHNSSTFLSTTLSFPGDGNEHVKINETLSGDLSGGLGPYSLTGTTEFIITGRNFSSQLGTFDLQETKVDLSGIVLGNTVETVEDAGKPSLGTVSIASLGTHGDQFLIDIELGVNENFIVNGGPPTPVGTAVSGGAPTPEPAAWALMLIGLGITGNALRRRVAGAVTG